MMILSVIFLAFLPSLTLSKPATAGQLPVSSRLIELIYGLEDITYNIKHQLPSYAKTSALVTAKLMNKVDELSIDDSCGDEATKLSTIKAITSKIVESTCAKFQDLKECSSKLKTLELLSKLKESARNYYNLRRKYAYGRF